MINLHTICTSCSRRNTNSKYCNKSNDDDYALNGGHLLCSLRVSVSVYQKRLGKMGLGEMRLDEMLPNLY